MCEINRSEFPSTEEAFRYFQKYPQLHPSHGLQYVDVPERFARVMYSLRKNRVSFNLNAGCSRGCSYCIQEKDAWYRKLRTAGEKACEDEPPVDPDEMQALLVANAIYPIYSLLDCSDYFMLRRQSRYRNALDEMLKVFTTIHEWTDKSGAIHRYKCFPGENVMLTVRPGPGDDVDDWLLGLHGSCMLTVFVSFGSLNKDTEPDTFADRLRFMREAIAAGLHVVPLFKPLVREWFDFAGSRELLRQIVMASECVVTGGLKLTPAIARNLQKAGVTVPAQPYSETEPYLDRKLLEEFVGAVRKIKPVSIYKHRACAMYEHYRVPCRVDCNEREFCIKRAPLEPAGRNTLPAAWEKEHNRKLGVMLVSVMRKFTHRPSAAEMAPLLPGKLTALRRRELAEELTALLGYVRTVAGEIANDNH